ncbi:fungal specific transcription factor domain-containing protein [Colletotrichum graminicola]|uniref:Fungal specific transcription factor domain-containing protein n=1 Tax=Colletotrichum graminicola (strain M1.001 / M2 / FGSC 10212) TaxID=645133 RepID=E3Q9G2_COLGM|nr:fungal specific transcription factor domain-containing protein [Colletotrichum graminicola M1.001]EFQ27341.1 fungal specific transcription factor domain-containing protein [Colletotrichum graminicola M1.001]WDK13130.1 fungal specific transcription factor domain-containing protein [Colletotrichum graminicola]
MDAAESPNATSESGTLSPAHFAHHSRKRKHSGSTDDRPTREYGLMRDTGRHDTSRFVGSGSGIHFIRSVYVRLARKSALRTSQSNSINDLVPGEDDQLRSDASSRDGDEQNLWRAHELLQDAADPPPFEQLVDWSKSYFEAWHPTLPFLSAPDVLGLFEKVSAAGVASLGHLERSIVKAILSISLADSRQRAPFAQLVPSYLVFRTVEEAMLASQFALCQPASIQATQAALAIQLFLVSMLRLNSASRLGGLIVRMAFHLGLHRCPSRYPFFTKEVARMRRRVFWCIYCIERFLCQALGLPLDIRDDDVDVCYPSQERHGAPSDESEDGRLQLLTYHVKHARIRGLILELRNKSIHSRDDTAERASYVQAELAKWSNEIHDAVEDEVAYEESASPPPISSGHRLFLLVLKYESMISLNRPMMTSDPSSPAYSTGLQNCIFAAKSIFIALKKYQSQNGIPTEPTSPCLLEPMLQPSFTWAVWISAFILIYAAFERQLPLGSALKHVESGKQILRHIASRDTSWPEYCLSVIDELTAAVRELSIPPNPLRQHPSTGTPMSSGHLHHDAGRSAPPSSSSDRPRNSHPRARFSPSVAVSTGRPDKQGLVSHDSTRWPRQIQSDGASTANGKSSRRPAQTSPTPDTPANPRGTASTPGGQSWFQSAARQDSSSFDAQPFSISSAAASFPSPSIDVTETIPGEGQESMVWYDQLFANSFAALDYPFLAAAQFDSSVDPMWSYLK